ncbi:MAG TPA: 3-keto-5-aminohexanoate cleavage protein [Aliidongia sp.]|nr:3-keto-5-aminohexanoate cleavage protein [Aliidongia sp.]
MDAAHRAAGEAVTAASVDTGWSPLILTVAPNGARRGKADHPALPITAAELAETAAECRDAGAAMIHLHIRDRNGGHLLDADGYRTAMAAIEAKVGRALVIQPTTEAVGIYDRHHQMALVRDLRPEQVSMAVRELIPNAAAESQAAEFLAWAWQAHVAVQHILYDVADVRRFLALKQRGIVPGIAAPLLFVLGRYVDGQQSDPLELLPFIENCRDAGESAPWAVCAFGRREGAVGAAAASLGGHVRVGFENNFHLADGRVAPNNATLVRAMAELTGRVGRPLATADSLREATEAGFRAL